MEDIAKTILLVEDDPIHAQLIKTELRFFDKSLLIDHVTTGDQCLDRLEKSSLYDLIILNYDLPEKDGFWVLRDIRRRLDYKNPVILLFSQRKEDMAKEALEEGATDCIIKTEDYTGRLLISIKENLIIKHPPVHEHIRLEYRPSKELVNFNIDGQSVFGKKGETIFDVARRYDIKIPVLCYNPAVSASGVCRICLVEVSKRNQARLVPSCVYPAQDNIKVKTSTEKVLKYRKMILELLMARCPDSELIKNMAHEMGLEKPRFSLKREPDLCILCGLCVQVCEEVIGANSINFSERGIHKKISTPFLEFSETCTGCGECAKICPTGALSLKYIDQHIMQKEKKTRIAIKCDGCVGYKNRACVNNCPTGALAAMSIEEFLSKNKGSINVELWELLKYSLEETKEENKND